MLLWHSVKNCLSAFYDIVSCSQSTNKTPAFADFPRCSCSNGFAPFYLARLLHCSAGGCFKPSRSPIFTVTFPISVPVGRVKESLCSLISSTTFALGRNDSVPYFPFFLFLNKKPTGHILSAPSVFFPFVSHGKRFLLFSHSFDGFRINILYRISVKKEPPRFFLFSNTCPAKPSLKPPPRARLRVPVGDSYDSYSRLSTASGRRRPL